MDIKRPTPLVLIGFTSLLLASCFNNDASDGKQASSDSKNYKISVLLQNSLNQSRKDEFITLPISELQSDAAQFNMKNYKITSGGMEIASQLADQNNDGAIDHLIFTTDFDNNETKEITIHNNPTEKSALIAVKRTQAELSVREGGTRVKGIFEGGTYKNLSESVLPEGHIPGDKQFRYEGPGWESDKVAYRLYFDHRNAMDIFGKKVPEMVLQNVGHDGYSYHKEADWGMDILKVGNSLGMGSLGMSVEGKTHRVSTADDMKVTITENGDIRSRILIEHQGWKIAGGSHDVQSILSIQAGSRMTENTIIITGNPQNLVTGLVKHQPSELIISEDSEDGWGYIATYGAQSYVNDNLGMAILYRKSDLIKISEDEFSQLVLLKPSNGKLNYYFLAAWQQEKDGIQTKAEFITYLKQSAARLSSPITIKFQQITSK